MLPTSLERQALLSGLDPSLIRSLTSFELASLLQQLEKPETKTNVLKRSNKSVVRSLDQLSELAPFLLSINCTELTRDFNLQQLQHLLGMPHSTTCDDVQNALRNLFVQPSKRPRIASPVVEEKSGSALVRISYPIHLPTPSTFIKMRSGENSILDAAQWLSDPRVRLNLFDRAKLTIQDPENSLYNGRKDVPLLTSPQFNAYRSYAATSVVPGVLLYMQQKGLEPDSKEGALLKNLVKASVGFLPLIRNDYVNILKLLLPRAEIHTVPDIGNCYFCSVAQHIIDLATEDKESYKTADQVRSDVSKFINHLHVTDPEAYDNFLFSAVESCPVESPLRRKYDKSRNLSKRISRNIVETLPYRTTRLLRLRMGR